MSAHEAPRARRILLVEDERHLAAGLKLNLELDGYEVAVAGTAREAGYQLVEPRGFDVIVLDVMLPDLDGMAFCRRLRESGNYTPVLMLTARDRPEDRVAGLEAGADDYLGKPFDLDELRARVASLLRRHAWSGRPEPARHVLAIGKGQVDFDAYTVVVEGEAVRLTQLEIDLLRYLASNAGRVVTREALLAHVWKLAQHPNTRVVDNFIMRLRRLLEPDAAEPVHLLSIRGAGYKLVL